MMKLKFFLLLLFAWLGSSVIFAQIRYPKREFRGAWIQCVNGQFQGMPTAQVQQTLIQQLDNMPLFFRCVPKEMPSTVLRMNLGAVS